MADTPRKPVVQVIAENLAYWMAQPGKPRTQAALAAASGVSQRTIGNYLNPDLRVTGSKGKQPSPKVYELDRIAQALGVDMATLVQQQTDRDRAFYAKIAEAYEVTRPGGLEEPPPNVVQIPPNTRTVADKARGGIKALRGGAPLAKKTVRRPGAR